MQTISLEKYGSFDNLKKTDLPVREPKVGEVRIRVHASALNPADYKVALGNIKFLHGRKFPMVLGYDFSGVIEALGENTSGFKVGDSVFGFLPYGPFNNQGAFGETIVAKVSEISVKPTNVSHDQAAAAATPAITALQSLRDIGNLQKGGRVLITGVSGGVGSCAISIAKRLGAEVVAIGSGKGIEIAKQLGADQVVDRKSQDIFTVVTGKFDVIFDAAAAYSWSKWKSKLNKGGVFITTLPSLSLLTSKIKSVVSTSKVGFVNVKSQAADLQILAGWLSSGMNVVVDQTIPVRDIAKGLKDLKEGKVSGRVVVDVVGGF